MKKKLLFLLTAAIVLLMTMLLPLRMVGQSQNNYAYTFTAKVFDANNQTKTLNEVDWTFSGIAGDFYGYDATKGQQFGSGSKPFSSFTLSTSGISGTITEIKVNTSGASSIAGTLNVTVGGNAFGNEYTLTKDATEVTFTGSASGAIVLNYAQTSSKAIYIKSISVTYSGGSNPPVAQTVATPTFSPDEGTYTETQSVSISCATDGATLRYTTDGTEPTTSSTAYTEPLSISETTTVKAKAWKDGCTESGTATATYTINIPDPGTALTFNKVDNHAVSANGKYLIVDVTSGKALTSANGTSSAPTAVEVTITNNSITTSEEALMWDIVATEGGYIIYPTGTTEKWLYSTNTNNGVRVGTNDAKVWTLDVTDESKPSYHGFLHKSTNRYLGVYVEQDWRAYTTINANIENTQIELFEYTDGTTPTPANPTLAASVTALSDFNYTEGNGPSATQNFTLSGSDLTEDVVVTAPANFELCLTANGTFGSTVSIVPTSGAIDVTSVYVRMAAGLGVNSYSGNLTAVSGSTAATVALSGSVTDMPIAATPTFSLAEGTYLAEQSVSISCTTDGATIYYTTDGTDPTTSSTVYSTELTIGSTTTLKAIAAKEGYENSAIASATYTILEVMTIADARALANNAAACVEGIVTFIDGRNVYIQDATAGIDLYLNNNTVAANLAVGDMVRAYGTKTVYKGLVELQNIDGSDENAFVIVSSGNELPLSDATIAEINADFAADNLLQSTRLKIEGAVIGAINPTGITVITQEGESLNVYQIPEVEGLMQGDLVTVTGVVSCYNTPQLLVKSADDVGFTHRPTLSATPASLSGLTYGFGDGGPSEIIHFNYTGSNLTGSAEVFPSESFEVSTFGDTLFTPENPAVVNAITGNFYDIKIYVRLKAGLAVGTYSEQLALASAGADTVYVNVEGTVTGGTPTPPTPPTPVEGDYVRISDLSQLSDGSQVIIAARHNDVANSYYAMTNATSGKPEGVLFASTISDNGEIVPASIVDEESSYYWIVGTTNNGYTFTNANGQLIGWTSSTSFATGGDNVEWTIENATAGESAMVPNYLGFTITNINSASSTSVRAFALNNQHNFGPYAVSNANSSGFNFYLDLFVKGAEGGDLPTPVVATPVFTPAAGTYTEAQTVSITCATESATIHYTTDGTNPTTNSTVYTTPITIDTTTTVKAFAVMDGYDDSAIATAEYVIEDEPTPPTPIEGDYVRIADLSQLTDGSQVIIASRYNAELDQYEAAQNTLTSNKLNVMPFVSTTNADGAEIIPADIVADESSYYWTVNIVADGYTFTNANGQVLSYNSGTNFNWDGDNDDWTIEYQTAEDGSLVPYHQGFVVTNVSTIGANTVRALALQLNTNGDRIAPYAISNMNGADYNFFLDLFVKGAEGGDLPTPTVIAPVFTPAGGTYAAAQQVTLSCPTAEATIYVSGESDNGPWTVYTTAIAVEQDTTLWAYATKEGFNDSPVVSATYIINDNPGTPTITATPNAIADFEYVQGEGPSASRSYILTSAELEGQGTVDVTASEHFEIALDNAEFANTITLEYANGIITNQPLTLYVRMKADLAAGTYTGTITHTGGGATETVDLTGIVHGDGSEPYISDAFMPFYIQGNNGSNNHRVPVAIAVYISNLEPNATYRYTNQFVDGNDGATTAGAGNVIYASTDGFYRSTNPSLANEGNYGELTADENGEAFAWFVNEPTANARFTPGNHVYLRIRLNDGNDGTAVQHTLTTDDYATVLNFGSERDEYTGTAFYAKSNEAPMSFAMMFANDNDWRPTYSTSIETVGIDYGGINQYASFYQELVAGNDGWFGGILPNDNAEGINVIWILDMESYVINDYYTENGFWQPDGNTANPNGGLDEPIFIDLTYTGIGEAEASNVSVWNAGHEFVIENGDDAHYTMTVVNLLGQAVMQRQVNAGSTTRISHSLAPGLYVIHLQNNRNSVSAKVIVR